MERVDLHFHEERGHGGREALLPYAPHSGPWMEIVYVYLQLVRPKEPSGAAVQQLAELLALRFVCLPCEAIPLQARVDEGDGDRHDGTADDGDDCDEVREQRAE